MQASLLQKKFGKQVSGFYSGTLLIRMDFSEHMKKGKEVGSKYQRNQRYQRCQNIIMDFPGVSAHWQLRVSTML